MTQIQSGIKLAKAQIKNAAFWVPISGLRLCAADFTSETILKQAIDHTGKFVLSMLNAEGTGFRFTAANRTADLYSTCYAIAFLGLTGNLGKLDDNTREKIGHYILSTQATDGLFRDPGYCSAVAEDGQGWGWQHLLPHTLIALDYLGIKPEYSFEYAKRKFVDNGVKSWLETVFSSDHLIASNHYMNTTIALQYARDFMADDDAGALVHDINNETIAWLMDRLLTAPPRPNILQRSRLVKTIYHILPSLLYDMTIPQELARKLLHRAAETQNMIGGFGTSCVSDACEDIDSVYCISVLADSDRSIADRAANRFLKYVALNQTADGGFVFRRFLPFRYGDSPALVSPRNAGNMFATWFRVLSIAFATSGSGKLPSYWKFSSVSGYQYRFAKPVW